MANADRNGNRRPNLIRRGFQNPDYSHYFIKDKVSDNFNTNKYRFYRIHFLLKQYARDSGGELMLFGHSPNDDTGSCGAWQFGSKTTHLVEKPWVKTFLGQWEKTSTQLEGNWCIFSCSCSDR